MNLKVPADRKVVWKQPVWGRMGKNLSMIIRALIIQGLSRCASCSGPLCVHSRRILLSSASPRRFILRSVPLLPFRRQATKAALVIQSNYRNYRSRPGSASSRQQAVHQQAAHQAARKIQQFMRQSKIKLVSGRVHLIAFPVATVCTHY